MSALPSTVADADAYHRRYYSDTFRFGQGTEQILDLLTRIPPVASWTDLGSGSESLLWACALRAVRLTAVDADPARLTRLAADAHAGNPRDVHRIALALAGTAPTTEVFATRTRSLHTTLIADLFTPRSPTPPALDRALGADLVTQFGLLGLTTTPAHFLHAFARLHARLPVGGWAAGANWVPADPEGRVTLTQALYRHTAHRSGLDLLHLAALSSADPDFPLVWTYLARRHS
ncbi:hypothetical protein [Nocardiopsis sp. CC223A]|uniref:hypothetical protein n=1 Tax=Nocardiopsis sp. CC223A TaxID=3044051 RepID=UPI00278C06EF|nr:hypothetical protein [Nocardiopsis sp. CC223A]